MERYLLDGIMKKDFASKLKKLRQNSFVGSDGSFIDESNHMDFRMSIHDIGEIFNYNYWINWQEEDPKDYLYGFKDIKKISDEDIQRFKDALKEMLPEHLQIVLEDEVLISNSGSSCITSDYKDNSKVYKEKENSNKFSKLPLKGKRSVISVGPENIRDAVILSVPQSNSVKLIEKQCALICEEIQGSAYISDRHRFKKVLDRFFENSSFFYDRDLTKEGITKPRQLVMAILDVLAEKYPECPAWKYRNIYSDYFLILENGEVVNPVRGHGLGMANALTTIMQCVINFLVVKEMARDGQPMKGTIEFITFNDDYSAGFEDRDDREIYIEYDLEICDKYQLIPKASKSHKLDGKFVFCEEYYPLNFNRKVSYKLAELYQVFASRNIFEAKAYFQSISTELTSCEIDPMLEKLTRRYGYEFYPTEWKYPYTFGGWVNPRIFGIRGDLLMVEPLLTREAIEAFHACRQGLRHWKLKGSRHRIYNSPSMQLFKKLDLPKFLEDMIEYNKSFSEIWSHYYLTKNDVYYDYQISHHSKDRISLFNKLKGKVSYRKIDLLELILEDHPFEDFLPFESIVKEEEIIKIEDIEELSSIPLPNPILSALAFFNPEKMKRNIVPSLLGIMRKPYYLNISAESLDSHLRFSGVYSDLKFFQDSEIIVGNIGNECNLYYDKISVTNAWATVTGKIMFPFVDNVSRERFDARHSDQDFIDITLRGKYGKFFCKLVEKLGLEKSLRVMKNKPEIFINLLLEGRSEEEEVENKDHIFTMKSDVNKSPEQGVVLVPKERGRAYMKEEFHQWIADGRPFDEYGLGELFREAENENEIHRQQLIIGTDCPDMEEATERQFLPPDLIEIFRINGFTENNPERLYQIFYMADSSSSDEEEYAVDFDMDF